MAFVNLEKVFDRMDRNVWQIIMKLGYPSYLVKVVKSIYARTRERESKIVLLLLRNDI